MKEEVIQRKMVGFSLECPICKKSIRGFSEGQTEHNLRVHLKFSHKKGDKKK